MKIIGMKSEEEIEEIRKINRKTTRKVNIETGLIIMFLYDCIVVCLSFMIGIEYILGISLEEKLLLIGLVLLGNLVMFFMPLLYHRKDTSCIVQYYDLTKDKKIVNSELIPEQSRFILRLTLEDSSGKVSTGCVDGLYGVYEENIEETTIDLSNGTVRFAFR